MPAPNFREAQDSMIGIHKIGLCKERLDVPHSEKLVWEEEKEEEEMPAPHFREAQDSMIGIQKLGLCKEL